jgi:dihydroorotate dehydrogenase electron transfer subunit
MAAERATRGTDVSRARRLELPVVGRRPAGRDFVWLVLDAPPDWRSLPGQFVNILCESDAHEARASEGRVLDEADGWPETTGLELGGRRAFGRRPYSIARVERRGRQVRLHLLVQVKGPGSRFLGSRPVGSAVDLVGPLGTHFTAPSEDRVPVLVSGGCGLAPIFGLAEGLAEAGRRVVNLFGAATLDAMPLDFSGRPRPTGERLEETTAANEFALGGVTTFLATDDGSVGFHGPVTAALETYLDGVGRGEPAALYGCGPKAMLKRLAEIAAERGLACEISLERHMGCGIGVCLSCVAKRRDPGNHRGWTYRLTCRDGPVMDAHEILWDDA